MSALLSRKTGLRLAASRKAPAGRKALFCKAFKDGDVKAPEWLPEAAVPAFKFIVADDVRVDGLVSKATSNELYQKYAKEYVESPVTKNSYGWTPIAEIVNGRAAMLGFLIGALGELTTQRPILQQLAASPLPTLLLIAAVYVGTLVPLIRGTKGDYLDSLQDTYSIPEGWFTKVNELVNARVAMLGLGSMLLIELITGRALL